MSSRLQIPPSNAKDFEKRWPQFKAFLIERGSQVFAPTNPYELARFTTPEGFGIVYRNEAGRITSWQGGANLAWAAFVIPNTPWRAEPSSRARNRETGRKRDNLIRSLIERDGPQCLFCPTELTVETATIEHIVPVTGGGTEHINNKALACDDCNKAAGCLSVVAKIRLAIAKGEAA